MKWTEKVFSKNTDISKYKKIIIRVINIHGPWYPDDVYFLFFNKNELIWKHSLQDIACFYSGEQEEIQKVLEKYSKR